MPALLPFWLATILAAFIGAVLLSVTLGYPLANQQQSRGPLRELPPEPRLQSAPALDLRRYQTAKHRELHEGAVPIEVAMRETARQGWGPP